VATWIAVWITATVVLAAWEYLRVLLLSVQSEEGPWLTNRYVRVAYSSVLVLTATVVMIVMNEPAPAIVYKAF
jgi:hypothetical protein